MTAETKRRLEEGAKAGGYSLSGWIVRRFVNGLNGEAAAYSRGKADGLDEGDSRGYHRGRAEGYRRGHEFASLMAREEGRKHGQELGAVTGYLAGLLSFGFAHRERPWQTFDLEHLARELSKQPEVARRVRNLLAQNGAAEKFDDLLARAQFPRG